MIMMDLDGGDGVNAGFFGSDRNFKITFHGHGSFCLSGANHDHMDLLFNYTLPSSTSIFVLHYCKISMDG